MIVPLLCLLAATGIPKLLVVDVDDLGAEFLADHPQPFFDALDANGRSYTRFYTAPVCSPTRAQLHYGAASSHPDLLCLGLINFDHPPFRTPTAGPLVPLGKAVTDAGYSAAKVGKWHMCPRTDATHPLECGWDSYVGAMSNITNFYAYPLNVEGTIQWTSGPYLTRLETDLAILAMQAGHDLVSLSYHAIHKPFHVPPADLYTGPEPETSPEMAAAMLEALGRELDRLSVVAQDLGYHLILFADNGGSTTLGGRKGSLFEAGIRTRMWCFGPSVVPGSDDSMVTAYDVYGTVLEFFGIPRTPEMGPDSQSFLATWQGVPGGRTHVFQELAPKNGVSPFPSTASWDRAVVGRDHKLMYRRDGGQFYDLVADPAEEVDLLAHDLLHIPQITGLNQCLWWHWEWTGLAP